MTTLMSPGQGQAVQQDLQPRCEVQISYSLFGRLTLWRTRRCRNLASWRAMLGCCRDTVDVCDHHRADGKGWTCGNCGSDQDEVARWIRL